jgi:hypothetical protein
MLLLVNAPIFYKRNDTVSKCEFLSFG